MNGELVTFSILAAVAVLGALWAVLGSKTFHAVMGLGIVLVTLAGLYISLNSPFLGVVQLLVYVGGIMTLFVFAVMFVAGDEEVEA